MLSDVTYPYLSGTNVARDFVELPSQLYEHWLDRPEVLSDSPAITRPAQPIADELIDRMTRAAAPTGRRTRRSNFSPPPSPT